MALLNLLLSLGPRQENDLYEKKYFVQIIHLLYFAFLLGRGRLGIGWGRGSSCYWKHDNAVFKLLAGSLASLSLTLPPASLFLQFLCMCVWGGVATHKLCEGTILTIIPQTLPSRLLWFIALESFSIFETRSLIDWNLSSRVGCLSERPRDPPISACPSLRLQECIAMFSFKKKIWVLGDWIHIITLVRHTVYQLNHLPGFRWPSHTSL